MQTEQERKHTLPNTCIIMVSASSAACGLVAIATGTYFVNVFQGTERERERESESERE